MVKSVYVKEHKLEIGIHNLNRPQSKRTLLELGSIFLMSQSVSQSYWHCQNLLIVTVSKSVWHTLWHQKYGSLHILYLKFRVMVKFWESQIFFVFQRRPGGSLHKLRHFYVRRYRHFRHHGLQSPHRSLKVPGESESDTYGNFRSGRSPVRCPIRTGHSWRHQRGFKCGSGFRPIRQRNAFEVRLIFGWNFLKLKFC